LILQHNNIVPLYHCFDLTSCPLLNSCWHLIAIVTVLREGTVKKWSGHEGWVSLTSFKKGFGERSWLFSTSALVQSYAAIGPSSHMNTLVFDFLAANNLRSEISVHFKIPDYYYLLPPHRRMTFSKKAWFRISKCFPSLIHVLSIVNKSYIIVLDMLDEYIYVWNWRTMCRSGQMVKICLYCDSEIFFPFMIQRS
jgi:hypothetical protein